MLRRDGVLLYSLVSGRADTHLTKKARRNGHARGVSLRLGNCSPQPSF